MHKQEARLMGPVVEGTRPRSTPRVTISSQLNATEGAKPCLTWHLHKSKAIKWLGVDGMPPFLHIRTPARIVPMSCRHIRCT